MAVLWQTLIHLKPGDFQHPNELDAAIVENLDRLIGVLGSRPQILSDFRPDDPRQHGQGTAIDTTWPGVDPLHVWDTARASNLFSGLGIYVNEKGAVSFHFDNRRDRSPQDPALWGGLITPGVDADTGATFRRTDYVTAASVLDAVKKKAGGLAALALAGLAAWWFSRR